MSKWIVFTAPDGALWWGKPAYLDGARQRNPGMGWVKRGDIPEGELSVTEVVDGKTVVTTLSTITVDGESIFADTDAERLEKFRQDCIRINDTGCPLHEDTDYHIIEDTDFPADHVCGITCEFRSVFEWDGAKAIVNMPKARGVHMDVIRKARNTELAAKDITFMRAVEAGDTSAQSAVATEKQTLRDIPQTFDLTTDTPEQLKGKWPTELPARE
jgi:hypothetical protein